MIKQDPSNVYSCQNPCFDSEILYSLRKAANTNLVIFLGAGISMDVNLPSWRELLVQLANISSIDLDEKLQPLLDSFQYDAFLEQLIIHRGSSEVEINKLISSIFSDVLREMPPDNESIYSHLARFPSIRVITTNYDNLCARFMDIPVYSPSEFIGSQTINEILDTSWCLALHGMYNRPETLVLSKESYEKHYQEESFKQLFSHMSKSVRLLFLGFSFKDRYYVKNLIESLSLLSAKHYALVEYSDDDEKNRLEAALPFFSFQFYKHETDSIEFTRRNIVKRYVSEIFSDVGPLVEPELASKIEAAYELFRVTATVEKGISELHELEIRTNGRQLPAKYSGYFLNAKMREAFIRDDLEEISRFEKNIEECSSTSTRYQLMLSLGHSYLNSNRYEKALEVLSKCKLERPEAFTPDLYSWCAKFKLGLLGDYENAIRDFLDEHGNIKTDVSDDLQSNVYQIIGEMGLSDENTIIAAENYLLLAYKLSDDVELLEDLGFCHLQKEKYFIEQHHYPSDMELTVARKYFEDAISSSVESINRCYRRIAVAFLEVLELLNLPMEYIQWHDRVKDYISKPADRIDRFFALAKFEIMLDIENPSSMRQLDEDKRKRAFEFKAFLKGDFDSYLRLMKNRIDNVYCSDQDKQREYLFALFNAKKFNEFKNRITLFDSTCSPFERELFTALLIEIDDPAYAEELHVKLAKRYDSIFAWNELLAFYRRHNNLDGLIKAYNDIQANHSHLIEQNPSAYYTSLFYTLLNNILDLEAAYRLLKGLDSIVPESILYMHKMDLAQRIFCLDDTNIFARKIIEDLEWKIDVSREKVAIIEYLILSLRFEEAEREIVEFQTVGNNTSLLEGSLIFQIYRQKFENIDSSIDYSLIPIGKYEDDVSTALMFINRFPKRMYLERQKICLDVQTLAAIYSKSQIESLLYADEIFITHASIYQLFLLMGNKQGEQLDDNFFFEIIKWIMQHKDRIVIGGCSMDDFFNNVSNPQIQNFLRLIQLEGYPEKQHIFYQLLNGRIILLADKKIQQTRHPVCMKLNENREFNILSDLSYDN